MFRDEQKGLACDLWLTGDAVFTARRIQTDDVNAHHHCWFIMTVAVSLRPGDGVNPSGWAAAAAGCRRCWR